jgi:formylglycine-generating enzyme required for sulfatase activity
MRDCEACPELVRIPAGPGVTIRGDLTIVKQGFYVGRSEVSVSEFQNFLNETGRNPSKKCFTYERASWKARKHRDFSAPGYSVQESQPASCVSFSDAQAYAKWLSGKTGQVYRLPTLHEWGRAAGTSSVVSEDTCERWNAADYSSSRVYPSLKAGDCDDRYAATASAGAFVQGPFLMSNLSGNVWEWVVDTDTDKKRGWETVIGGSWATSADDMSVASLSYSKQKTRASNIGFRVVRELPEKQVSQAGLRLRCLQSEDGDQC